MMVADAVVFSMLRNRLAALLCVKIFRARIAYVNINGRDVVLTMMLIIIIVLSHYIIIISRRRDETRSNTKHCVRYIIYCGGGCVPIVTLATLDMTSLRAPLHYTETDRRRHNLSV